MAGPSKIPKKPLVRIGLRQRPAGLCAEARRVESLILSRLSQGQCFTLEKKYLDRKWSDGTLQRTSYFVSGTITRVDDRFYCEFCADFGPLVPHQAYFRMEENGKTRIVPLVHNGKRLEHAPVSLSPLPGTEKVTLTIIVEGSDIIPGELFMEIKITDGSPTNGADDTNPTIPLVQAYSPVLELEQSQALGRALKASANPHLQMLGELFEATALDERKIFMGKLIERKAGLWLVEAAARIICLYHPMMDIDKADLNDHGPAYLAAFHSQTPIHLHYGNFSNAFEKVRNINDASWIPIAKLSLLALLKSTEGRENLQELSNTYYVTDNEPADRLLQQMIEWGERKLQASGPGLLVPAENCLEVISGLDEAAALHAAAEYLRFYGFIRLSDLLE